MNIVTDMQEQMRQQAIVAEKRRKREREDQAARAAREREEPPLTLAHVAARAELAETAAEHTQAARKSFEDRGATPGVDQAMQPGQVEPEDFRRGYLEQDHASRSPLAEPPRTPPLPPADRGILRPLELSAVPRVSGTEPAVEGIARHSAMAAATAGRPPVPGGSA